jgi:site-specific recombinase XerD
MGAQEVQQFLTHLAVEGHVAASTQSQALSAILFLYQQVLKQDIGWLHDVVRAKQPQCLKGARNPRRISDFMKKQCVAALTQLQNRYPLAQRLVNLPYGIATHRSCVAAPVPQRFGFTGRLSPHDHR